MTINQVKNMNNNICVSFGVLLALASFSGCIQLKTESEIKPIHITMDVNLKVDKAIDNAFADENMAKPKGDFTVVKDLIDRKVAGVSNKALLEARTGATDDDRISIAEANAKGLRRMSEIAKSSGVTLEAVQKRRVAKIRENLPAGSWYQTDAGSWVQK